ncbi:MAG: hypothetical protein AAB439_00850 [Patescibacteria group bacterium]
MNKFSAVPLGVLSLFAAYVSLVSVDMWDGEMNWFTLPDDVSAEEQAEYADGAREYAGEYSAFKKGVITSSFAGLSALSGFTSYRIARR